MLNPIRTSLGWLGTGLLLAGACAAQAADPAHLPFALSLSKGTSPQAVSAPAEGRASTGLARTGEGVQVALKRLTLAELRKRYQAPGDRYVYVGGVELRYRDEGTGPVLLLLHGSRSTLNAWDGVATRLKGKYRILRFDQPPTGLSGPLSDAARKAIGSPEALVAGFLDKLGVQTASVFGVSSGGTLAYYFAATYPERVDALILANTPSDPVIAGKTASTPALDAAAADAKRNGYEARSFWSLYLDFLYGEPSRLKPATIDYYTTTNMRTLEPNPFGLHALTNNNATTLAHLHGVRAPVLIVWGMRDLVLPAATAGKALQGYLDHAKSVSFVALDSVGHYPPMESPNAVADLVDAYLKRDR
jgi:pimeloyl-ACP methyl ester carboxylesterase